MMKYALFRKNFLELSHNDQIWLINAILKLSKSKPFNEQIYIAIKELHEIIDELLNTKSITPLFYIRF